jgi:hypothetical protein
MRTLLYLLFLVCLVLLLFVGAFAGFLKRYPGKMKRLRRARQLVARRQESSQGAEEVGSYPGSLVAPSWRSNRLCG